MTREDAKEYIIGLLEVGGSDGFSLNQREALQMAISALEQPTDDDLISRQDAIDCVKASPINGWVKEDLIQALETTPSAQPEIIRCKDCKHGKDEYNDGDCYCSRPHRTLEWVGDWEFYCAAAERRPDEQTDRC